VFLFCVCVCVCVCVRFSHCCSFSEHWHDTESDVLSHDDTNFSHNDTTTENNVPQAKSFAERIMVDIFIFFSFSKKKKLWSVVIGIDLRLISRKNQDGKQDKV
jgi:hypothetical protein